MKKIIYNSLFLILIFTSKVSLAQPCANALNIYTFTAAGVNYEIVKELKSFCEVLYFNYNYKQNSAK